MLTKEQALDKIKELKEYVEELDKPKEPKEGAYGFYNPDGNYWYLSRNIGGVPSAALLPCEGENFEDTEIALKTEKHAQKLADALEVWQELCVCDGARSEFKVDETNWTICWDFNTAKPQVHGWCCIRAPFEVYFDTEEQGEAAMEKLGEEKLKKLYMV